MKKAHQKKKFRAGSCANGKSCADIRSNNISAQLSVGSLSVTMGFLCDDGVFVWRSSRDSNPVTIGPVLIFSVTIATPLC